MRTRKRYEPRTPRSHVGKGHVGRRPTGERHQSFRSSMRSTVVPAWDGTLAPAYIAPGSRLRDSRAGNGFTYFQHPDGYRVEILEQAD